MRELKFRAWSGRYESLFESGDDEDFYFDYYVDQSRMALFTLESSWCDGSGEWVETENYYEDESAIFDQSIGLQDIDGRDIFQNDICEIMYYTPFGDKTNDFYGKWIVTKWMGRFILVSGKERIDFTDFAEVTETEYVSNIGTVCDFSTKVNVRIIGNIHQNPELLK